MFPSHQASTLFAVITILGGLATHMHFMREPCQSLYCYTYILLLFLRLHERETFVFCFAHKGDDMRRATKLLSSNYTTVFFYRSRSRSPGESRARLPPEVLQQLEFGLVEPNDESLRGDIPYKQVETNGFKPQYHQAAIRQTKTRSVVSETQGSNQLRPQQQQALARFNRGSETASMVGSIGQAANGHMPRHHASSSRPPPPPM